MLALPEPIMAALRQGVATFLALGPVPIYFDNLSFNKMIDSLAHAAP